MLVEYVLAQPASAVSANVANKYADLIVIFISLNIIITIN